MRHLAKIEKNLHLHYWKPSLRPAIALAVAIGCFQFLMPRTALAQANAGITGTITDSSGAVVPGAKVTVTEQTTAVSSILVSSSAGTYAVKGLNPGHYTITVEAAGFEKEIHRDVNVEVSLVVTIDIVLSAGATSQTVEVTSPQIALNTTQPQLGSTVEPEVVASLPNLVSGRGRDISALQFLVPGTTGSQFSHRIGGGVDFEQEIVYNGIPVVQPETEGYTTNFNPPFELVQEFRVERSTFAAQFGLGLGALTYQMASGGNTYHGDLFEIMRNSWFDSVGFFNGKDWNSNNPDNKPPTDHEHNYGFSVGGPISIPKVYDGRNRTFGHYSQEWFSLNNLNQNPATVPSVAMKSGDFSHYVDSNGNVIPIFDPTTGAQFQCNGALNVICPARISPTSAILLPYIPDPDQQGSGPGGQQQNKSYVAYPNPTIQHVWGFTVDQVIDTRQSVHFSMWHNHFHNVGFDNNPFVIPPNPLNSLRDFPAQGSGYLLTYNHAYSANISMTAGAGWIGEINDQLNHSRYSFPAVQGGVIPPNITFDGQSALTSWGTSGSNSGSINRKLGVALVNNWLWTTGRQTFNIGGEFRRSYQDDNEEQTAGGQFNFSQRTTSVPYVNGVQQPNFNSSGSSFASFLLGIPDNANRTNSQELQLRNYVFSPYIQDDIKLSPKLTVNVGVRWDIMSPFTENHNNIVFFNPNGTDPHYATASGTPIPGAATKFGACIGCAGYNKADIHWGHFGPRVGFAYKLNEKSVVQAGFSVAFLNGGAYEYGTNKVAVNYGNLLAGSFKRNSTGTAQSAYGSWDTNILPDPPGTPFNTALGAGTQINAFSKNDGYAPYAQQWNANYQRELPYNMFLTVAWLGNRIIHLPSQLNKIDQLDPKYLALGSQLGLTFNNGAAQAAGFSLPYSNFINDFGGSATVAQSLVPYPQYSNIFNNFEGSGTTYYQSIQVEVDKRFTNGLAFLSGYTLSHQMDNTSSGFSSFANGGINKFNQKPEWVISSNNPLETLKISGTYELPIGPGKKYFSNHGVTGQIFGGWQVAWVTTYVSGTPLGVTQNGTPFPNGFYRPLRVPGVALHTGSYNRARTQFITKAVTPIFNPAAFTDSPPYTLADTPRNFGALKDPAFYNENFNARKRFFFGERFTGILQVDYFNALNRTIFNGPDTNVDDSTFGQVVNQGCNNQGNIGNCNRQGQVTFRLEF
ncbi:TonB-dependent receptor [Acidisarcina polymorpha]|nr:TonB-dependent receptor [Acidisarcina polymorpha]